MKESPVEIFRRHGGQLRMREALDEGISRYMLYALRDRGIIEQVNRGLYRLASLPPLGNPDLVAVAMRIPQAVVCLLSALAYHDLTTQIPHSVYIAIPHSTRPPVLQSPPLSVHKFSDAAYKAGVEHYKIDEIMVPIYNAEKTVADCFKFRNKIGLDVAVEALKLYTERPTHDFGKIWTYAGICRVDRIIQPYLEALV